MDVQKATTILGIEINYTQKQLKRAYHLLALKYHPDKTNNDVMQTEIFKKVNEAYEYLIHLNKDEEIKHENKEEEKENHDKQGANTSYSDVLNKFLKSIFGNKENMVHSVTSIITQYQNISLKIIQKLNNKDCIEIYETIIRYKQLFGLSDDFINELNNIMKDKISDNSIFYYTIEPTIDNLFNNDICIITHDNKDYCVPSWHSELVYDTEDSKKIYVFCKPKLDDYINIDENNNIHINVMYKLEDIFDKECLNVMIGTKRINIPVKELHIRKNQVYILKHDGISHIDHKNVLDISKKKHIYVHITIK